MNTICRSVLVTLLYCFSLGQLCALAHTPVPEQLYSIAISQLIDHLISDENSRCFPVLQSGKDTLVILARTDLIERWDAIDDFPEQKALLGTKQIDRDLFQAFLPNKIRVAFAPSTVLYPEIDDRYVLVRFSQIYEHDQRTCFFIRLNYSYHDSCVFWIEYAEEAVKPSIKPLSHLFADDWG